MKIVGANGILSEGEHNVDRLLDELRKRGYPTLDVDLPLVTWVRARWSGRADGHLLAEHSHDGDIVVAHSFGCLRAWYAHKVRDYAAIVCIAPAMSRGTVWNNPERVYCFYSPQDWAVRVGSWLPWHPFGGAGIAGFKQKGVHHFETLGSDHNDYFKGARLTRIIKLLGSLYRLHS